jgi:hypothetical protein
MTLHTRQDINTGRDIEHQTTIQHWTRARIRQGVEN